MAKDKLTEYSATNASNDVIGDISVAEGMLPSAVNNALREQMTHLKNFSDGTDAIDALAVDNLRLDGNTISSTDTNGDITLDPNGTGNTIIASNNLLVGKTSDAYATAGFRADYRGFTQNTRDGNTVGYFNRLTSDGPILEFSKDSGNVGNIQTKAGFLSIGTGVTGLLFAGGEDAIEPHNITTQAGRDNAIDLGSASVRFDDIRATNGTIQTSDQNDKQQISSLTNAEITAAKSISTLFKTFKWNDKVEAKGDAARTHAGVIAQDVQAAMTAAGLDATKYAFWCSDTWWEHSVDVAAVEAVDEVLDDDGNVVTEAVEAVAAYTRTDTYQTAEEAPEGATQRTRLGIRYPELLAFVGAATEHRLADIETRLAVLEA